VQGEYLSDVRPGRIPRSARVDFTGGASDSPIANEAVAPDPSHNNDRQLGCFVAFELAMFAAGSRADGWSVEGTNAIRAFALLRLAVSYVREAVCGLHGHNMVLHFEPERLSLQCLACGARTQGWTIEVNPVYRRPHRQIGSQAVHRLDRRSLNVPTRQYESESSGEQLTAA
jgi:hypothetical protein